MEEFMKNAANLSPSGSGQSTSANSVPSPIEMMPVVRLTPCKANPRTHSKKQNSADRWEH